MWLQNIVILFTQTSELFNTSHVGIKDYSAFTLSISFAKTDGLAGCKDVNRSVYL